MRIIISIQINKYIYLDLLINYSNTVDVFEPVNYVPIVVVSRIFWGPFSNTRWHCVHIHSDVNMKHQMKTKTKTIRRKWLGNQLLRGGKQYVEKYSRNQKPKKKRRKICLLMKKYLSRQKLIAIRVISQLIPVISIVRVDNPIVRIIERFVRSIEISLWCSW